MCCNNLKQKAGESDEDDAGNAEQTGDDDVDDREVDRQADELPEKADNKEQDIAQNGVENEFQNAFDRLEEDLNEQHHKHNAGGEHQKTGQGFHELFPFCIRWKTEKTGGISAGRCTTVHRPLNV